VDSAGWDARYEGSDLVWSAEPNQFVEAETSDLLAGDLPPGRALDLAAGEGRNAIWLAENGWTVTAVDFSRAGLQKAAHLATARGVTLELVEADVTAYAPDPGAFDLVLVAYLQTPEPDRRAWLRHAVDALAPGGTLLIVCHDRSNLDGGHGGPQDASVLTTPEEVAAVLTADGRVEIDRAALVERIVATPDGDATAIDHLVRAHRTR
jgi:SAM-dependent methyltransferase